MARKRHTAKQIIHKLREAEVASYNPHRRHSSLGQQSSVNFKRRYAPAA